MDSVSSSPRQFCHLSHAVAQLCRPTLSILTALASSLTVYALNPSTAVRLYFLTAIVLFCMTAAAFAINDYSDIEKDRINHPERPLPSGRLLPPHAWWIAIVLFSVALLTALFLGIHVWLLVVVSSLLLWNYSAILNVSGILGNFVVATMVAAQILLGGLVANRPLAIIYPAGFLFCYSLAKEIIWDIHDAVGDRKRGVQTIANRWGVRLAFRMAWGLLILLLISIPVAILWLPMRSSLLFGFCSSGMLLSFAVALRRYECELIRQSWCQPSTYQGLIFWGRLGMVMGVIGLLGGVHPL